MVYVPLPRLFTIYTRQTTRRHRHCPTLHVIMDNLPGGTFHVLMANLLDTAMHIRKHIYVSDTELYTSYIVPFLQNETKPAPKVLLDPDGSDIITTRDQHLLKDVSGTNPPRWTETMRFDERYAKQRRYTIHFLSHSTKPCEVTPFRNRTHHLVNSRNQACTSVAVQGRPDTIQYIRQ